MQRAVLSFFAGIAVLAACRPASARIAAGPGCAARDGSATVAVTVVDTGGRPVRAATVSANWIDVDATDSAGVACLRDVRAGSSILRVERLGFRPESATVRLAKGRLATHAFTLRRVVRPCCRLDGTWEAGLDIVQLNLTQPEPTSRTITGLVVFSDQLPDWVQRRKIGTDSLVHYESGYSGLDLRPFFGSPYAQDVSTTVSGGGGGTLLHEMTAIVPAGDSVEMTLIPRMSHGGLSFSGRITGDTIRGKWVQNAYSFGAEGLFVMHRVGRSPASDSLIAVAIQTHARDLLVADSIRRARAAAESLNAAQKKDEPQEIPPLGITIEGNDGATPGDRLVAGQRGRLTGSAYRHVSGIEITQIAGTSLVWSTTNPRVLAVDSAGRFEAKEPGTAYAVARVRASGPSARFAEGIRDSMPFTISADVAQLGRRRYLTVAAAPGVEYNGATCAITTDRRVECLHAAPGTERGEDDTTVVGPALTLGTGSASSLAVGDRFACALADDGATWCWGDNSDGELADGDTAARAKPVPVVGGLRFRHLTAAREVACAVSTDDRLYCWGMLLNGGLGDHATDRCSVAIERLNARVPKHAQTRCARRPVPLLERYRVLDVAAGGEHICAIAIPRGRDVRHPELLCWGEIYNMGLQSTTPVKLEMPSDPLVSLVSGNEHECGLTAAGEAWCWGRNWAGQAGVSSANKAGVRKPARVETTVRFRVLSGGGEHSCGLALDGRAWCWGYNRSGQLGDGTIGDGSSMPRPVTGGLHFQSLAAGSEYNCGVTTGGALWCWGGGLAFRASPGSYHDQPEPFPIAGWSARP